MIFLTSPGKTYSVNSVGGCTISAGGTTLATIPANVQTTFIAPEEEVLVSDNNAIIVEVTGVGAGGSGGSGEGGSGGIDTPSLKFEVVSALPDAGEDGIIYLVPTGETGDNKYEEWVWVNGSYEQMGAASLDLTGVALLEGDNTFTASNTFTGEVDMSGAQVTPPSGWNVADLTPEAIQAVVPMAWSAYTTAPRIYPENSTGNIVIGDGAVADDGTTDFNYSVTIGANAKGGHLGVTIGAGNTGNICSTVVGDYCSAQKRDATVLGYMSHAAQFGVAVGAGTYASGTATTSLGTYARTNGINTISVGYSPMAQASNVIVIGSQFDEKVDGATVTHKCNSYGTGSITIGAGANTLNYTATDGTVAESSNAITIGCKAENKGNDSVVIGASATSKADDYSKNSGSVVIGAGATHTGQNDVVIGKNAKNASIHTVAIGAESNGGYCAVSIGYKSKGQWNECVAVGGSATTAGNYGTAVGGKAGTEKACSVAVGYKAKAKKEASLTFGASFTETVDGQSVTHTCSTEGTGSITIGAGANTKNTTTTVDGVETTVESSNSITIGCKASNTGADSVVIGAGAKNIGSSNVFIGVNTQSDRAGDARITAVGRGAHSYNDGAAIGYAARGGSMGTAVGSNAYSGTSAVAIGYGANATDNGTAVAAGAQAKKADSIAVGRNAAVNSSNSIAIGTGATINNITNSDNTVTPSENTTVIGYGATASAPKAVVIGAGARAGGHAATSTDGNHIAIGTGSTASNNYDVAVGPASYSAGQASVSVGYNARAESHGNIAIGASAVASNQESLAIGRYAAASQTWSTAIGFQAKATDQGVIVLATRSTIDDNKKTQFYIAGAGTALANEYYSGEAFMGYTVTDTNTGDVLACGTRRLSELFPDNSLTQPASLDENGEWVMPKVFHPSDLDLPVEEPQEPEDVTINIPEPTIPEPEPYTPLPVYPIVEPEDIATNLPEPEPYTPLPVYPIVEPEIEEIPSES